MRLVLATLVVLVGASFLGGCYVEPVGWGGWRHDYHEHGRY